jgi:hypothetical protein
MIATASHQAIGGPAVFAGNAFVILSCYLGIIIILVVFGIWGFRLGSRGPGGGPGGGEPRAPEPVTPPPGGRERGEQHAPARLDLSRAFELTGLEDQVQDRGRDLVGPRSQR